MIKMGVVEPFRFGERMGLNGYMEYDAITTLHFFGEEAWAIGLDSTLKPSHVKSLLRYLTECRVSQLNSISHGRRNLWRHNGIKWVRVDG
jgi:hypothetical protein